MISRGSEKLLSVDQSSCLSELAPDTESEACQISVDSKEDISKRKETIVRQKASGLQRKKTKEFREQKRAQIAKRDKGGSGGKELTT